MRGSVQGNGAIGYPAVDSSLRIRAEQQSYGVRYIFASAAGASVDVSCASRDRQARVIAHMLTDIGIHQPVTLIYRPGISYIAAFYDCMCVGDVTVLAGPASVAHRELSRLRAMSGSSCDLFEQPPGYWRPAAAATDAVLDPRSGQAAVNAVEPVPAGTKDDLARALETAAFRHRACHAFYRPAPTALIVAGGIPWSWRGVRFFDPEVLRQGATGTGSAGPGVTGARAPRLVSRGLVSVGRSAVNRPGMRLVGNAGKMRVAGPSVAEAYVSRPEDSRGTAGSRLVGAGQPKDLINTRGGSCSPQDIELTAGRSSVVLCRGGAAAFTVTVGDQERLVIAHEVTHQSGDVNVGNLASAIRAAVAAEHALQVGTVVLLPPEALPRTSYGKVRRRLCAVMFTGGQFAELGRSTIHPLTEPGRRHLDRSSLLSAPAAARERLLRDYLCGLISSVCRTDAQLAADVSLRALGVGSCDVVSIQHSIETDLGAYVTASDLGNAASITDLAARLVGQLKVQALPSSAEAPASAWVRRPTVTEKDAVRLYCWVGGARLPAHAARGADFPPGGSAA